MVLIQFTLQNSIEYAKEDPQSQSISSQWHQEEDYKPW